MLPPHLLKAEKLRAPPPPGSPYSVPLAGTEQADRTAVYRHWRMKDGLLTTLDPKIRTTHDMFHFTAERQPRSKFLGRRPWDPVKKTWGDYVWDDYGTIAERRANFGVGIVDAVREAGVATEKFPVGLWCTNCPEWQITDLACSSQSLFSVSLYETLGPDAVEYIANHAALPCIAASISHIPQLIRLKPKLPHLKIIISLDPLSAGEPAGLSKRDVLSSFAEEADVKLYDIHELEARGQALGGAARMNPPSAEDITTINYTSGTTGPPKGVVLTHACAVAGCSAALITGGATPDDVGVSYLPLAHIFSRMAEGGGMWAGSAIGYFHGNILELVDDLKLLRPTGFNSVPRLLNRFGGAIKAQTLEATGVRGALSRHVVSTKLEKLKDPNSPSATNKHLLYDRIWGRKVAAALGLDRVRTMASGSAPLDPDLQQFFRVVLANNTIQGWGMTETYGSGLAQVPGDFSVGNCGGASAATELCLLSVPDMDYLVTDKPQPRGELLIRGNAMFSGYYKNEEENKKAILPDGWFKTGDIATVDSQGRFQIIDRRKNVLKLAQGEYISPERIENVYLSHLPFLAQAYVHGDSSQTNVIAIFGVLPEMFAPFATKVLGRSIAANDLQAVAAACRDERVAKAVVKELEKIGKKHKFMGYEKVKACRLYLEPFTVENELLTPTLKLKRPQTAKKFRSDLDALYEEVNAANSTKARL